MKKNILPGNRKSMNPKLLIIIPVFMYVGFVLGVMASKGKLLSNDFFSNFLFYIFHPVPFTLNSYSQTGMLLGFLTSIVIILHYNSSINDRRPGQEYGDAHFISGSDLTRKYGDESECQNKLWGETARVSIHNKSRNLNATILGGSGTGKTFYVVLPNLYQAHSSYVILDAKGTIIKDTAMYLKRKGYQIKVLNLMNPEQSMHYNPFRYLKRQDDVISMIDTLIQATTPRDATKGDPFWQHSEAALLQALCFLTWLSDEIKPAEKDFRTVIKLVHECTIPADPKVLSPMDKRIDALEQKKWKEPETGKMRDGKDHPAVKMYRAVMGAAEDTKRSVVISCVARLQFLMNSPTVLSILTGHDEMEFETLGMGYRGFRQKTALYLITPVTSDSYNAIITMAYSQLFHTLYTEAERHTDNCSLPIPVSIYMDEMANVPIPSSFEKVIATCRSYKIDISVFFQSLQQAKTLFKDNWRTVVGCCDTLLFLGMGTDYDSLHSISELIGSYTLEKRSYSSSQGSSGSSSQSDDVIKRSLLLEQELRILSNDKEIIIFRGEQPVMDYKYKTAESDNYRLAKSYGPYRYTDTTRLDSIAKQIQSVQVLSPSEAEYETQSGQPIISIDLDTLDRIKDQHIEFQATLPAEDIQAYALVNINNLDHSSKEETEKDTSQTPAESLPPQEPVDDSRSEEIAEKSVSEEDSIKSRVARMTFTDAQMTEAYFAMMDGLSEQQILSFFYPDIPAEEMERQRKQLMQTSPKPESRSR